MRTQVLQLLGRCNGATCGPTDFFLIQRTGVKTERVEARPIVRTARAVGGVEHDEAMLTIVTVRSDGYIDELFVNKTGQHVKKGEPLFRLYSSQIQLAQSDLIVAMRTGGPEDRS